MKPVFVLNKKGEVIYIAKSQSSLASAMCVSRERIRQRVNMNKVGDDGFRVAGSVTEDELPSAKAYGSFPNLFQLQTPNKGVDKFLVYSILDDNGIVSYIGRTSNFENRKRSHMARFNGYVNVDRKQRPMYLEIKTPTFKEIVPCWSFEESVEFEKAFIQKYRPRYNERVG